MTSVEANQCFSFIFQTEIPPQMTDTPNPLQAALDANTSGVPVSTIMNIGMQYGKGYINENQTKITSSFLAPLEHLRPYFFVNDAYVREKLKRLVFPFRSDFNRKQADEIAEQFGCSDALPVSDACAPDLFIPIFAVATLAVLQCFHSIVREPSPPEMVFAHLSRYCVLWAIEVVLVKASTGMASIPIPVPWLNIAAWCGYIHFPLVLTVLFDILCGPSQWRVSLAVSTYLCASWMYFFYRTIECTFCYTKRSQLSLYILTALQVGIFYWLRVRFFYVGVK